MDDVDNGADAAVEKFMQNLEKEGISADGVEQAPLPDEDNSALPNETGADENLPPEEKAKTTEQEQPEAETPIEPPASWRSDEKDLFRSLPREAQEVALRLQQAQDSHFTQRSTELAQARRAADDERQQYQSDRARYQAELGRVAQMAAQLLPAKFQDIQTEQDYLRLKATDPARASEFEAFQMALGRAQQQQQQLIAAESQERLNQEYMRLVEKMPDMRDPAKASALMDGIRKTAVEFYGFAPQEVQIIQDHRYVPILQDAMNWRQYQANLKATQAKKAAPAPTKVLRQTSTTGQANLANDQKQALLNRARAATSDRDKADLIAKALGF